MTMGPIGGALLYQKFREIPKIMPCPRCGNSTSLRWKSEQQFRRCQPCGWRSDE